MTGRRVRGPHGVAALLFVLVWVSIAWFGSFELNPNTATRLFAAIGIAERGDPTIDRFQSLTIDKAHFGRHFTMDKAPGVTLMAVPVVWAVNYVTGETSADQVADRTSWHLGRFLALRLRWIVALVVAPLTAFAAVLLLDLGAGITGSPSAGLFAALGYALGSIIWGWSATLLGHAPVAALLVIATWAAWRAGDGGKEEGRRRYPLMLGLALGWAVVVEFPAIAPGLAIAGWAAWQSRGFPRIDRRRFLSLATLSGVAALLPLLVYNQLAFGTPFRLGYSGVVGFTGMDRGLFGLTYPKPDVLFQLLFGTRRGLFWVSPVLLAGVAELVLMLRRPETKALGWLAIAVMASVLLVNASYFYWDGGGAMGPRHSVPAIPFLALGLAPFWAWLRHRGQRRVAAALLGVSMLLNLAIAATDIYAPEEQAFPLVQRTWFLLDNDALRTWPGEWFGLSPWWGLALYLDLALPLIGAILILTRRAERISRAD